MINRLKILAKIDDLTDEHCTTCEINGSTSNKYCHTKCNIGEQLRRFGDLLLDRNKNKVDNILAKGENATTKDVKYLLNQGLTRVKIAKSIGITQGSVKKWFDELEGKTIGGLDMSKPKSNYEKVEVMVKNGEKIDLEKVAKELGVSKATVYTYVSKVKNGGMKKDEPADTSKLERENKALKAELSAVEEDMKVVEGEYGVLETVIENLEQMNEQEKELTQKTIRKFTEIEKENIELKKADAKKLEQENNWMKAKMAALEKRLDETKAYSKHVNEELEQLQEESKRKDTEITLHKQDHNWLERSYNELNKSLVNLQERNKELRAEAQKMMDRLQAELDAERAKHEHLSSYARILMKKEGVANA